MLIVTDARAVPTTASDTRIAAIPASHFCVVLVRFIRSANSSIIRRVHPDGRPRNGVRSLANNHSRARREHRVAAHVGGHWRADPTPRAVEIEISFRRGLVLRGCGVVEDQ